MKNFVANMVGRASSMGKRNIGRASGMGQRAVKARRVPIGKGKAFKIKSVL